MQHKQQQAGAMPSMGGLPGALPLPGGMSGGGMLPGAVLLFEARGKTKVKRAFVALDAIRREGESLEDLAPHRWRALHNALQTRPFTSSDGSDPSWPRV